MSTGVKVALSTRRFGCIVICGGEGMLTQPACPIFDPSFRDKGF